MKLTTVVVIDVPWQKSKKAEKSAKFKVSDKVPLFWVIMLTPFQHNVGYAKGSLYAKNSSIHSAILIKLQLVTDRQTDIRS